MKWRERVFFVVGEDFFHRQRAIQNLTKRILGSNKTFSLNRVILSFDKNTDLRSLWESLFGFSFKGEKVIILKNLPQITSWAKELLLKNARKILENNYLIFDIEEPAQYFLKEERLKKDKFFTYFIKRATILRIKSPFGEKISLGELVKNIRLGNLDNSLYILNELYSISSQDSHSLGMRILAYLIKSFSSLENKHYKESYLKLMWETDKLMKEKNLNSKIALEILLTKLIGV